jgi:hypothetical protein
MESGHSLALAFDTDTMDFARGVEVGRLWEQLKEDPEAITQNVMAENAEMMLRLAEATGRAVRSVGLPYDRIEVTFSEAA